MNGFSDFSLYLAIAIGGALAVLLLAQWTARRDVERRMTMQAAKDRQAIEASQKQVVDILDNLPIGILALSGGSRQLLFSNDTADGLLMGRAPKNLPLTDLDGNALEPGSHPFIGISAPSAPVPACLIDAGGRRRHLAISSTVIHDERMGEDEIIYMIQDETLRVETGRALERSHRLEALGTLTRGVAHDFNNLLTPIVGTLDLIRRDQGISEASNHSIDLALQATSRATTLVHRLLAFVREQDLQPRVVDLKELVEGTYDLFGRNLSPDITTFIMAKASPMVAVDPNQLELAMLNIMVNARDAMPEGGTLTVTIEEDEVYEGEHGMSAGRYARMSFTDTGVGMTEEVRKRAVEPFFTTKESGSAAGLGLSMVHGLAGQSGGALLIESTQGHGTRIDVWLPVVDPYAETPSEQDVEPARHAHLLVVDDEDIVRETTVNMLVEMGHTVVEASSGPEAISMLRRDKTIDGVVADHLMPGMTGGAMAYEIWDFDAEIPVLLISGYTHTRALPTGIPYLLKPFRRSDMVLAVDALLEGRKLHERARDESPEAIITPPSDMATAEDEPIIANTEGPDEVEAAAQEADDATTKQDD